MRKEGIDFSINVKYLTVTIKLIFIKKPLVIKIPFDIYLERL